MDYRCPHIVTEYAETAVPYCQICAPKYIAAFRAKLDREKLARVFHRHDSECAQHLDFEDEDDEAQEVYRKFADAIIEYFVESLQSKISNVVA